MTEMHISPRRCHTFVLVLYAIALTACGLVKPMPPPESFSHRISDGTAALYWNCSRPGTGLVRVEGWANNPYYPGPIKDLEFILYGVNAQDGTQDSRLPEPGHDLRPGYRWTLRDDRG